jgi:hypothetical protein
MHVHLIALAVENLHRIAALDGGYTLAGRIRRAIHVHHDLLDDVRSLRVSCGGRCCQTRQQ